MTTSPVLLINDLCVGTASQNIVKKASLSLFGNEVLALVGESGSGKSMIARMIMGLSPSPMIRVTSGEIWLNGQNLLSMTKQDLQSRRGRDFAYIPQSPLNALNPLMSIASQLYEAYDPKSSSKKRSAKEQALFLLQRVGFVQPELILKSYPHQLSGGMRQRVLIAMALMNSPRLLIADEPTTALDVTLQAEILYLLKDLKKEFGLSILFITHDLGIVARIADRVAILRHGTTIEEGSVDNIFYQPQHPYTRTLIDSTFCHPSFANKAPLSIRLQHTYSKRKTLGEKPTLRSLRGRAIRSSPISFDGFSTVRSALASK